MRGNGHWGDFPKVLQESDASIEIEFIEIPGNGTLFRETSPMHAQQVIDRIRVRSKFCISGEPFNLCGISLGGMVALDWAQRYPHELSSVVAINTSLSQYSPFYRRVIPKNILYFLYSQLASSPFKREKTILWMTSNCPSRRRLFVDEFAKFSTDNPVSLKNMLYQLLLANNVTLTAPQRVPTKIIVSECDRLVHPSCSQAIAHKLCVDLVCHASAGHDLPLDDPKWLSETLLKKWPR